ncbi:alpha/beta fold hydrolase [Bradyrhizobium sp. 1(2017)]|uniref:alpha/beta fold hydrolase n=1 Tax=Bradyrhizobium sp. 1(2017) TaxID=1404888 RepID=UPI00140F18AB|nr:alpha/beta fold hydrolase [Bradyrhizobium sp. 1(2017)]QIO35971.1 alpha/beta fold hydrolase [Bradyrhizobium sp. 1(2017)]
MFRASDAGAQTPFYRATPQELDGPPGSLIRSEPMAFAPAGAQAYRVLYRSVGMQGEPIAVSGVIVVPPGPAPAGGRPIVAWAHPTTGVVPHCAPSLAIFVFQQMAGLRRLIEQGAVVAATDYPGLGTAGPHPYLVGASEARAAIDSVRAARTLPDVGDGNSFAVWGHSQGGQASLYTGLIANTYAPELRLVGVAAAAPATSLVTLMGDDFKSAGGKNLTAMTLWSWSRVYGAPIDRVVLPEAMPTIDRLSNECIESVFDILERRKTEKPLEQQFLSVPNIAAVQPWRSLAMRNSPGTLPPTIPLFLAQGTADNIVRPEVTRSYMQRQCTAGGKVSMMWVPGVGHGFIARDSADAAVAWMMDRFAGRPAPSDCGKSVADAAAVEAAQ